MGFLSILSGTALLAFLTSVTAQNQAKTSTVVGTASSTTQSRQLTIASNGCATFNYTNSLPGFNYTATLGLAALPSGCSPDLIRVVKQYTYGACPETRANNYQVAALKITNKCTDNLLVAADPSTCSNLFAKAPAEAYATKGIGAGSIVDTGKVCWQAPSVFYFVQNNCPAAITATIKLTTNAYSGVCTNTADSDDGGDDAGGSGSSKKSSGLSSGAKAGIVIGVVVGVVLIAVAIWFFCCQIRA